MAATYALAQASALIPCEGFVFSAANVSEIQGGADHVHPQAARHLDRRAEDEALEPGVHHRDRGAARHRLVRQNAAGERDRPVVPDVVHADAHQVDLPHQLAPQAELEVIVAELRERPERGAARAAHHRVDRLDALEQLLDRARVLDVHLDAQLARCADHLVPALERGNQGFPDRSRGADDDDLHDDLLAER